ncbi:8240_t:CDS:2 [Paraglomus occultum]|uniref:8240_t:CDS:1 n=1 Tax=Paraglomus occultum TaxID=144539 RepID=A0A9N9CAQ9_9GLOM|nr:8240_t:CDS:2 [Paraglomus occultum]
MEKEQLCYDRKDVHGQHDYEWLEVGKGELPKGPQRTEISHSAGHLKLSGEEAFFLTVEEKKKCGGAFNMSAKK